jgi:hypothetical protein
VSGGDDTIIPEESMITGVVRTFRSAIDGNLLMAANVIW